MAIDTHEHSSAMNDAGMTSGMFDSLRRMLSTLLGLTHTRLQLLTTELQEEVQRAAHLLLWAFVALFAAMMALFLAALAVIFVFWETHRIAAALTVIGVFLAIAIAAVLVLQAKLKSKPPMLDNTLAELAKDRDRLRHL
jgi:uncharacterized membrane protein YqjE